MTLNRHNHSKESQRPVLRTKPPRRASSMVFCHGSVTHIPLGQLSSHAHHRWGISWTSYVYLFNKWILWISFLPLFFILFFTFSPPPPPWRRLIGSQFESNHRNWLHRHIPIENPTNTRQRVLQTTKQLFPPSTKETIIRFHPSSKFNNQRGFANIQFVPSKHVIYWWLMVDVGTSNR